VKCGWLSTRRGEIQGHFLRTELAEPNVRNANGIRFVDDTEWDEWTAGGELTERFDLSGDKSNAVATYKRSYTLTGTSEVIPGEGSHFGMFAHKDASNLRLSQQSGGGRWAASVPRAILSRLANSD